MRGARRRRATRDRLTGYVVAQYEAAGLKLDPTERWSSEKVASVSREHLSEAELASLAAEGSSWTEEQAVARASLI
jgi:hypothetical protein